MNLTDEQQRRLRAVLSGLLPGDGEWPAAGDLGLEEEVARLADLDPDHPATVASFLEALPGEMAGADPGRVEELLGAAQAADPDAFGVMVLLAYNAYYTDPRVLRVVEARTGYAARPPQPLGYELEPFDESLLKQVRARAPFYRQV